MKGQDGSRDVGLLAPGLDSDRIRVSAVSDSNDEDEDSKYSKDIRYPHQFPCQLSLLNCCFLSNLFSQPCFNRSKPTDFSHMLLVSTAGWPPSMSGRWNCAKLRRSASSCGVKPRTASAAFDCKVCSADKGPVDRQVPLKWK